MCEAACRGCRTRLARSADRARWQPGQLAPAGPACPGPSGRVLGVVACDRISEELVLVAFEMRQHDDFRPRVGRDRRHELEQVLVAGLDRSAISSGRAVLRARWDCAGRQTLAGERDATAAAPVEVPVGQTVGIEGLLAAVALQEPEQQGRQILLAPSVDLLATGPGAGRCPTVRAGRHGPGGQERRVRERQKICYIDIRNGYLLSIYASDLPEAP